MNTTIPDSIVSDRKYLGMEYKDYHDLAQALSNGCVRDKYKNHVVIRKMKLRKIQDMRTRIVKSEKLSKSLIFKEILRQLTQELAKRKKMKGRDRKYPSL